MGKSMTLIWDIKSMKLNVGHNILYLKIYNIINYYNSYQESQTGVQNQ